MKVLPSSILPALKCLSLSLCCASPITSTPSLLPHILCHAGWADRALGCGHLPMDSAQGWVSSFQRPWTQTPLSRWTGLSQQARPCHCSEAQTTRSCLISQPRNARSSYPIPSPGKHLLQKLGLQKFFWVKHLPHSTFF